MVDMPLDPLRRPAPRGPSSGWWILLTVLFIALLIGCVLAFPRYLVDGTIASARAQPPPIADRLKAENDVRTTLLQGLGALVLLAGAVTTWLQLQATLERNREEMKLSQEGQITERFTRAIDQIGSDTLAVRMGGIYALERIARVSDVDHGPIMEVLTAFVRERAPRRPEIPLTEHEQPQKPATDIQAILTVLGRRVIHEKWREPRHLDLSYTDLRWAEIQTANLRRVSFFGAILGHATFSNTHLEEADFNDADLRWSRFFDCYLDRARLELANKEGLFLKNTSLEGAVLD